VPINVHSITFSFGVNALAMNDNILANLTLESGLWPGDIVAHDRQNLIALVGDLLPNTAPGGVIGRVVDRLRAKAIDQNTTPEQRAEINKLISNIERQVNLVRVMFNEGMYKGGIDDAYKMLRHIKEVVNLGAQSLKAIGNNDALMVVTENCKSGKDRTGMSDVESKAQSIIEDMGGQVTPGKQFSPQDQIIYNTVLTSSGQLEVQQLNTGLPGSKNSGELSERINDPDALLYSSAFSSHTSA
jgi:phosphatidylinositol-4,5-bisphosphate 4-phosphatase